LLRFATDHQGYVRWALSHLIAHPAFQWQARGPRDWRQPPPDWAETRYQEKARRQGRSTVYLDFRRRDRV
jgi:tRNA (guanine-N7-)-methyltransferase